MPDRPARHYCVGCLVQIHEGHEGWVHSEPVGRPEHEPFPLCGQYLNYLLDDDSCLLSAGHDGRCSAYREVPTDAQ